MDAENTPDRIPIRDLARYFLRLGLVGFGGPVALVGQMEREMVGDKKWLSKEEMREGIAVCQSLPARSRSRSASGSRTFAAASGGRGRAAGRSSSRTSSSWPRWGRST